jgi:DNA-binding NtrC family response regulator
VSNILVVDDTPGNLRLLMGILDKHGYEVRVASNGALAMRTVQSTPPDLILLDIKMPSMDGYQVCEQLKAEERTRDIPVIFISALSEVVDKVKGFEMGGVDYITKPFQPEEVLARVETHLTLRNLRQNLQQEIVERKQAQEELTEYQDHLEELVTERTAKLQQALAEIQRLKDQLQAENIYLREEIKLEHNFDEIIGQSEKLRAVLSKVEQVAPTDTIVLISGETGTGKELIARALHHASSRKEHPLVKVNCAALPVHLIESELFGHEKGAFTGAATKRIGRFELAHGGTIFLDEIGELPLELQPKLLRVLQEGEFERLGSSRTIRIDVRVITATNRNLKEEAQAGRFRQDLFYRLNVYPLSMPPLRERPDDIPLLVRSFVQKFGKKLGKQIETIPQKAMHALQQYTWPGNIRELENVIERAVITTQDKKLQVELPESSAGSFETTRTLEEVEREYLIQVLKSKNWRIEGPKGAAIILGLHPNTLRFRMRKLGIKRPAN